MITRVFLKPGCLKNRVSGVQKSFDNSYSKERREVVPGRVVSYTWILVYNGVSSETEKGAPERRRVFGGRINRIY